MPGYDNTGLSITAVLVVSIVILAAIAAGYFVLYLPGCVRRRVETLNERYPGIDECLHSKKYRIRPGRGQGGNRFKLGFPHWMQETKDGSCDHRYSDNCLVNGLCVLHLDEFLITCVAPDDMIALVRALRNRGANIAKHELEREKLVRLREEEHVARSISSTQAIVRRFADCPSDFENYCAEIYRRFGCEAEVTPPTNDGGYDILLQDEQGLALIECKCFDASHAVGRPLLQKLVGANATVNADRLIFITTSSFSEGAVDYARHCGIPFGLVDGSKLLKLHEMAYGSKGAERADFTEADWQLEWEDIEPYYPPDYFDG